MFGSKLNKIDNLAKKGKVDNLIKFLSNKDTTVRIAAIKALGTIKKDDAVNNLISCANDPDPAVRTSIIEALTALGDSRALEHLRYLSNADKDASVREKALEALKKFSK